ncbi:hypothetical protein, partial [Bacillus amyloliquefaciens]|uniref:hypothetical protein n=1 Tax=Bacillus amyloliquefaciens TaxID=1390 RepID=UPI0037D030E1
SATTRRTRRTVSSRPDHERTHSILSMGGPVALWVTCGISGTAPRSGVVRSIGLLRDPGRDLRSGG